MATTSESMQPHIGKERNLPVEGKNKDARVTLAEDTRYAARLEVFFDGTTYEYGITRERRARYLGAVRNGDRVQASEPDWMRSIFNGLDIERDR